jgi:hypothetical protein
MRGIGGGGGRGVYGSEPMSPNKLWRSTSIFNLGYGGMRTAESFSI